jgi:phage gp29-like protein
VAVEPKKKPTVKSGQVVRYSRIWDERQTYVTDSPTAGRIKTLIRSADEGRLDQYMRLSMEMEAKDAHLQAVANTRRGAVTALEWDIQPADTGDEVLAQEAADYCRETLRDIDTWDETLEHLATAIGPNISVVEMVWEKFRPVATVDVPGHRLTGSYTFGGSGDGPHSTDIRIITDDEPLNGIATDEWGKWIVYTPNSQAGFPFRRTLSAAMGWLYLIKHYVTADWASFSEVFGSPMRYGTYSDDVPDDDKAKLQELLQYADADAWAMFHEGIKVSHLEAGRGTQPYAELIEWIEKKTAILWLGQTLSTDVGAVGSFAAAKVHDNVRTDILLSDLRKEARCIRSQVLRPMTLMKFPRKDVPIPHFKRTVIESKSVDADRLGLERLKIAKELGVSLSADQVYEWLGTTPPEPGKEFGAAKFEQPEDTEDDA